MSLHDRIMAIEHQIKIHDVVKCTKHPESVICEAAEIAKEADELMGSLAAALGECQDSLDSSTHSDEAEYAQTVLEEYRRWRDKE